MECLFIVVDGCLSAGVALLHQELGIVLVEVRLMYTGWASSPVSLRWRLLPQELTDFERSCCCRGRAYYRTFIDAGMHAVVLRSPSLPCNSCSRCGVVADSCGPLLLFHPSFSVLWFLAQSPHLVERVQLALLWQNFWQLQHPSGSLLYGWI